MIRSRASLSLAGALALLALVQPGRTPAAHACGCFAPPNPAVPIVQSGERIVFAVSEGVVTAHIQIQYSGDPEEFAWLVPMPAVPALALGTDELFRTLLQATQPSYQLVVGFGGDCGSSGGGCGSAGDLANGAPPPVDGPIDSPLVARDAIGPYEYAVLEADQQQPMLDWLAENGFFVPAGTDAAVTPYIRPGGYFLALKLRKGQSVGDLQPIVVEYASQLPQIPIVLTSVAAEPDMPVLVWVFGEQRAVPRNYFHAHINDALINWVDGASNYFEVVSAALDEADGHHAFITEYAGTTGGMSLFIDAPGRFDNLQVLRLAPTPGAYLEALQVGRFPSPVWGDYTSQMLAVLGRHIPIPPEVLEAEATDGTPLDPQDFYLQFRFFEASYPEILEGAYPDFDADALTTEIEERVVVPTQAAFALFEDHPYLTRLFSMLSPEEMTRDPTFGFNPDLPDVSNTHTAVLRLEECSSTGPGVLVTEHGWELYLPEGTASTEWLAVPQPASLRIEMLREEGQAQVVTDNTGQIAQIVSQFAPPPPRPSSDGCAIDGVGTRTSRGLGALLLLFGLAMLLYRRRSRA